jgi:hypothetical protein
MAARTDGNLTVADRGTGDVLKDASKLTPEARHRRLMSWFDQEMRRQSHNRFQMALDEDYYDSMQWQADEANELKARGQNPVVYNETKPMIDWLIGVERRTRTDFKVYSRDGSPEGDEDAKNKTKLLKYLQDVNRTNFERSSAADDQFKAGLGWIEVGISPDPEDEPIYKRAESWRNMLYDSLGTRRDLEDSRYLFRFRIVDLDVAVAYFPDKEVKLRASCVGRDNDHYMEWWNGKPIEEADLPMAMPGKFTMYDSDAWARNERDRVLLIECWHYEYTRETRGGAGSVDRVRKKMHCTVMTERHEMLHVASPYAHNKFPFIPYWCYRRKKDNAPYSPVRPVRGPQDSLNKRMSKALFVLSTNQVWIEADAVDPKVMTSDEIRDEAAAPDGFIMLKSGGLQKFKTFRENDVAQGHLQLAQADQAIIRNASGITSENLGRDTNITAGIALQKKSEQGSMLTAEIFDNQLFARQLEGELELSLIEQFYNQPKVFSIAGERAKREYVRINQPGPTGEKLNDVTARKAQFVIGEDAWKQTLQQAAFESLMDLLSKLAPTAGNVVMALLPEVFELADIPNKQTIVQKIRTVTGHNDPDEPLSPEQQAAQAAQQEQQDMQNQLAMKQLVNDIKAAEAKGEQLDAQALKTRIESLYVAMQAGQVVATVPGVAAVADELLASVGFKDKHPAAAAAGPALPAPVAAGADTGLPVEPQPQLADGAAAGIETPAGDGVLQPGAT